MFASSSLMTDFPTESKKVLTAVFFGRSGANADGFGGVLKSEKPIIQALRTAHDTCMSSIKSASKYAEVALDAHAKSTLAQNKDVAAMVALENQIGKLAIAGAKAILAGDDKSQNVIFKKIVKAGKAHAKLVSSAAKRREKLDLHQRQIIDNLYEIKKAGARLSK